MSEAKKETIPEAFDVGGEFHHLADSVTMSQIRKRTLKNGLIQFLKQKNSEEFIEVDDSQR